MTVNIISKLDIQLKQAALELSSFLGSDLGWDLQNSLHSLPSQISQIAVGRPL